MRVTVPGDIDLDVRPGTTAATIARFARLDAVWCGQVRLDPEHPAGTAPLVHAALLSGSPRPEHSVPAGAPGPVLRVAEGPDAGGAARVGPAGVTVGRGAHCDLRIADPAVSLTHAIVHASGRVRDAGSSNGTRGSRRLADGGALALGRSVVMLEGAGERDRPSERPGGAPPWAALAAGGAAGIMIAVVTGRWYLALIGLAAPAAMLVPAVVRRLRTRAASGDADAWVAPEGPIAVEGEQRWARGYVRGLAIARGRAPAGDEWWEPWMRWLEPAGATDRIVHVPPGGAPPSWCPAHVTVGPRGRRERTVDGERAAGPLAVSAATAESRARHAAGARGGPTLPESLRWGDLDAPSGPATRAPGEPRRLVAPLGRSATGALELDLDADGPHLLVAGTTGSGKSVTLETLVGALALAHPPSDLALALVDFKGGAGLRSSLSLPHVCGALTDLDGALATRVIDALSDELAARKLAMAAREVASITEWERAGEAPPRLLVVIDEYQEIAGQHPGFLPDLARLAAQGRSLGLHLVLATQRPAGAVTPEVRANVSTVVALRVASAAESRDLLGTAAAAELAPECPGRAVVARAGLAETVQIAAPVADPSPSVARVGVPPPPGLALADAAARRWEASARAPALWLPVLPGSWQPESGPSIRVAIADWPRERRQHDVAWEPSDGPAVIVGPARSGRTSALRSIAAQASPCGLAPVWLPGDAREAARTVHLAAQTPHTLLIVDDAERALARLGEVDDGSAADSLLTRLAMRAPTALACAPHAPMRIASAAAFTALLPGADPSTLAAWGAPRDRALTRAHPGRAWVHVAGAWTEGQLCRSERETAGPAAPAVRQLPERVTGHWAVGGDDASPVAAPRGAVAVIGPPGAWRDTVAASMREATVTCHDLPHLAPPSDAVVLLDPTPRALRALAPRDWRGIAEPLPRHGRAALVRDGAAIAIQLGIASS